MIHAIRSVACNAIRCSVRHRALRSAYGPTQDVAGSAFRTRRCMSTRRLILEACVRSRLCYAVQAERPSAAELKRLESCWNGCLRLMVRGGFRRKGSQAGAESEYAHVHTNEELRRIVKSLSLSDFVTAQALKFIAHTCRHPSTNITQRALFAIPDRKYHQDPWQKIASDLGVDISQAKSATQNREKFTSLLHQRLPELRKASDGLNSTNSKKRN